MSTRNNSDLFMKYLFHLQIQNFRVDYCEKKNCILEPNKKILYFYIQIDVNPYKRYIGYVRPTNLNKRLLRKRNQSKRIINKAGRDFGM